MYVLCIQNPGKKCEIWWIKITESFPPRFRLHFFCVQIHLSIQNNTRKRSPSSHLKLMPLLPSECDVINYPPSWEWFSCLQEAVSSSVNNQCFLFLFNQTHRSLTDCKLFKKFRRKKRWSKYSFVWLKWSVITASTWLGCQILISARRVCSIHVKSKSINFSNADEFCWKKLDFMKFIRINYVLGPEGDFENFGFFGKLIIKCFKF